STAPTPSTAPMRYCWPRDNPTPNQSSTFLNPGASSAAKLPTGATVPMFDFDRVIDRRGTHASKWDMMAKLSGITAADGIPMWVADMDFAAPPGVTEALQADVTRAVHGYY